MRDISIRVYFMAKLSGEQREVTDLLGIRRIVNAINKGVFSFTLLYFINECCYSFVSKKHKLFNKLVCIFSDLGHNCKWFPFFIKLEFNFCGFKIHCSLRESLLAQFYGEVV